MTWHDWWVFFDQVGNLSSFFFAVLFVYSSIGQCNGCNFCLNLWCILYVATVHSCQSRQNQKELLLKFEVLYTPFLHLLMWHCHKFWTFRRSGHVGDLAWSKRYQIFLSVQVSIHRGSQERSAHQAKDRFQTILSCGHPSREL
jgi:hypothetical protein